MASPNKQPRHGRSVIVVRTDPFTMKHYFLCSSHTLIPSFHMVRRSSTNGSRYTLMSLPGYFGSSFRINIMMRSNHNKRCNRSLKLRFDQPYLTFKMRSSSTKRSNIQCVRQPFSTAYKLSSDAFNPFQIFYTFCAL